MHNASRTFLERTMIGTVAFFILKFSANQLYVNSLNQLNSRAHRTKGPRVVHYLPREQSSLVDLLIVF